MSYEQAIKYIQHKSGDDFSSLKTHLSTNGIAIFLLTKKLVGKSIYIHHLQTLFPNEFEQIAVGDIVRGIQNGITDEQKVAIELELENTGSVGEFTRIEQVMDAINNATVKNLLPTSIMELLIKIEINKIPSNKSIIFDGIPRAMDQIEIVENLVKELENKGRKTLLVEIDLNDKILDDRQTARRICPVCGLNSNILTVVGGTPRHNSETNEFYLECDSATCKGKGVKLEGKAGETDYESMILRRRQEEQVNNAMRARADEKYIYLRSDVLINKFEGDKEMDLNLITKYSLDENNDVELDQTPQIGYIEESEAFSLAPTGFMPILIREIVKKI